MRPNKHILYLWGIFLVLGIVLVVMQIYLARIEIQTKRQVDKLIDTESKKA
jgi:hypothetical protein